MRTLTTALSVAFALCACGSLRPAGRLAGSIEGESLLGAPLERLVPSDGGTAAHYEAELAEARARWEQDGLEDDAIWVGRHLGYLGRYRAAIEWFTDRLRDFPSSARLRRHRGHRYLSTRRFDLALRDLEHAWALVRGTRDEVEPDGAPNRYGIPRSTTHTNVLYHLALARYLRGEWDAAADVWWACLARCTNDDMRVATMNWLVHALRRGGRGTEARAVLARVEREMDVLENFTYHRLLLLQKGLLLPDQVLLDHTDDVQDATALYGVATWSYCNGNQARARALWRATVDLTPWNAFGHLAAEADLARHGW